MKKGKVLINSLILLIISTFLVWYILKNNFATSIKVIKSVNVLWLILAMIIFVIYFLLETIIFKKLINEHKKDYSYKSALKLHLMSKFFNGITPFSSGGQPFQLLELKKEGITYLNGTTVLIKHFFVLQTSLFFIYIITLIFNLIFKFFVPSGLLLILLIIGFIINIFLILIVIFLSKNVKICEKIISFFVHVLYKLKLIKNKEKVLNKINKSCLEYQQSYQELMSNKKYFYKLVFIESSALIFNFSITFFAFKAVGCSYNNYLGYLTISSFVYLIGSYVPIPGGTVGMEYAFINLFKFIVPSVYISVCLILWRIIDYYLPMIIGGITFNFEKTKRDLKSIK
ncbi:MAG: YbhN family protein [Bacilli bacterium]